MIVSAWCDGQNRAYSNIIRYSHEHRSRRQQVCHPEFDNFGTVSENVAMPKSPEEWLEQVLDEDPSDVSAQNDLGYLWADQNKRLNRSLRMIRNAVIGHQEERLFRDSARQIDEPVHAFYRARTDQRQASARAIGRVV